MHLLHFRFSLLCALCAAAWLHADSTDNDLEGLFEESSSEIARSRLNVDYTPSVLSVLHHEDLQRLGITDLFDALGLLPGIETSITQNNHKKVTMRRQNLPNSHSYQKVKLVVDGIGIDTAMYGNSDYYMNLPVSLIKRIEVLRGPGSSLYGTGAFNGVISVTTWMGDSAKGTRVFGGLGSETYSLGGLRTHQEFSDGTGLWLDGYWQADNERIEVDRSYVHPHILDPLTFAPITFDRETEAIGDTDDVSVGMKLRKGGFSFDARYKENKEGNLYGWDEALELTPDKRRDERYLFARLEYAWEMGHDLSAKLRGGMQQYRLHNTACMFEEPVQHFFVPTDLLLAEKETTYYTEFDVNYEGVDGHHITGGASFHSTRLTDSMFDYRLGGTLLFGPELFPDGLQRDVTSFYANDSVGLTPDIDALASLRYDYYSDHQKGYPSLQLGAIYKQPDWRLKFNYAHAYKVPNWVELYARIYNPDGRNPLVAETSDGLDLILIYQPDNRNRVKLNAYYARLHDVIDANDEDATSSIYSYVNLGSRNSYGLEAEYDYTPDPSQQLHLNLSYSRSTYISPDEGHLKTEVPDTAKLMIKGHYLYYFTASGSIGTTVRYIGHRKRQEYVRLWSVKPLGSYTLVDLTLAYDFGDTRIEAGMKNLFDDYVRYGSFYSFHDGIPDSGRQWFIRLEHRF